MKNFTNNFKQFTSRLSARWLIMALMMLVGTSSAWAAIYLKGSFNGWGTSNTFDGNGNCTITLSKGDYTFKIDDGGTWYGNGESITRSNCLNVSIGGPNGSDMKLNVDVTGSYKFYWNGYDKKLTVTYPQACTQCCDKVEIKHPWGGGDWTYKTAEECDGTVYSLEAKYGNNGCNWKLNDGSENWISQQDSKFILVGSPSTGDDCIFSFNTSNNTITITKVVTCDNNPDFSVSLSKSEVAVGCTGVTASITGDDRNAVTVTWSSTNTSVATINNSTGAITIKAAGTTTIKATTTEAGGFCGGVEKPATLTVKSPSVTVSPNDNSLCEGETLTLTATLTNCGVDNSIQWYKGDDPIEDETSATLTISSVTTDNSGNYKAVVSDGILCSSVESTPITISVNARPSAPSLDNPEPICYGTPFTLPEKDNNKKTITWNVNNRELTNLSVGTHTYIATIVENGCESTTVDYTITVKEQLAKPDLAVTNVKQCGSNYTAGKIVISNHDPNNTYILKKGGNPIDKTYDNGYSLSENEIGTYTVEVSKDGACGATSDDNIGLTNNTPTVTPFEITKQANVCMGNPVTLSYDGTAQSGTISYAWYEGDSDVVLGTEETLTIQQAKNASYKLVVTVTSNDCPASDEATTTVEPKAVPSVPTFDNNAMDACVNQQFTLPTPNNLKYEEEPLWTVEGQPTTASQTINEAGEYTYIAYKNDGCPSQGTPFTVRVNPLPTITSISASNDEPVPFEDVVLTATDITQGAEVKWYSGNDDTPVATGTTYIVTSETAGDVIVKAKAFLNGCESEAATKTVTFGEEDCSNSDVTIESTKIEIWCRETGSSQAGSNLTCYAWYKDGSNHELNSDDTNKGTKTIVTKTSNIEGQEYTYRVWEFDMQDYGDYDVYVIFKKSTTAWDWQTSDLIAGKRNNRYFFTYDGSQNEQSNRGEKYSESQSLSVTTHSISAPAVKTVSVNSEQGSGVVNFVGRVIKTGCAAGTKIYVGYQYKKADDEWPTNGITAGTGEKQLIPIGNNLVDFSKNIEGLGDGDYHFRAYVINGYGRSADPNNYDQGVYYGIDILVKVSTKKYPIRNLQVQYANDKGDVLQDQNVTYCVRDDAYIKLIYDGSRLNPEDDVINISSTLENTFTLVEGEADLYTFVVKGNETITVNAKNKENTDNPTAELTINTYAVPVIPSIDIDKTTICSNDATGAKITVSNPQVGMTYQVYKILGESEPTTHGAAKKYSEGVLEFNSMKEAGTYYVRAYNEQCPNAIAQSLDEILSVIDAEATSISISPESKTVNPWVPVTFTVSKEGNYDYTFSCKEDENDVTSNMVINRSGDTYVVKFPKPDGVSAATDLNGQVTFADKTYYVEVKLNADVQCGTFNDESEVTLKPVNEICN